MPRISLTGNTRRNPYVATLNGYERPDRERRYTDGVPPQDRKHEEKTKAVPDLQASNSSSQNRSYRMVEDGIRAWDGPYHRFPVLV